MKKTILFIITILTGLNSLAQNNLHSVEIDDEYSWENQSKAEICELYLGIGSIEKTEFKYYFRHERDGQIIDIYSKNGESFSGELINSITQYRSIKTDYGKNSEPDKYIYEKVEISIEKASEIGKLILNQKFYSTPTDTLIEGWEFGWLDCGVISFSFKIENIFQYSQYTCHWNQNDSIAYAKLVRNIYDTIGQILDLQNKYSGFISRLEKGKTYSNNHYFWMHIMTEKQSSAFQKRKPQREYLQSYKDTIDSYLKSEIAKQHIQLNEIHCFENYHLTFNENGKLEKVKVSEYNKPELSDGLVFYFEDKRKIRKCRKLIEQIFKDINLSSFNLKYKVNRTLTFGLEHEVQLKDYTTY